MYKTVETKSVNTMRQMQNYLMHDYLSLKI